MFIVATVTHARRLRGATRSAEEMFRAAEPLLAREAGRLGRLFGGASPDSGIDEALDAVRERFGDDAIVRGRGFGVKLERQGPSKTE